MIRKLAVLTFLLALTASLSFAADTAKPQTLTGVVTDAMCGANHMMEGGAAQCTKACVKEGSAYGLVVDKKVYKLEGKTDDLVSYAGEKATVTGTITGDTIKVASVAAAK
jgi:hypothetical protein